MPFKYAKDKDTDLFQQLSEEIDTLDQSRTSIPLTELMTAYNEMEKRLNEHEFNVWAFKEKFYQSKNHLAEQIASMLTECADKGIDPTEKYGIKDGVYIKWDDIHTGIYYDKIFLHYEKDGQEQSFTILPPTLSDLNRVNLDMALAHIWPWEDMSYERQQELKYKYLDSDGDTIIYNPLENVFYSGSNYNVRNIENYILLHDNYYIAYATDISIDTHMIKDTLGTLWNNASIKERAKKIADTYMRYEEQHSKSDERKQIVEKAARSDEPVLKAWAAEQARFYGGVPLSNDTLSLLARDKDAWIRGSAASYTYEGLAEFASPDILSDLLHDTSRYVRASLAENEHTPADIIEQLAKDDSSDVRMGVFMNPHAPEEVLNKLCKDNAIIHKIGLFGGDSG